MDKMEVGGMDSAMEPMHSSGMDSGNGDTANMENGSITFVQNGQGGEIGGNQIEKNNQLIEIENDKATKKNPIKFAPIRKTRRSSVGTRMSVGSSVPGEGSTSDTNVNDNNMREITYTPEELKK